MLRYARRPGASLPARRHPFRAKRLKTPAPHPACAANARARPRRCSAQGETARAPAPAGRALLRTVRAAAETWWTCDPLLSLCADNGFWWRSVPLLDVGLQERHGERPVAVRGAFGDAQRFGSLLGCEAGEVPELDDLGCAGVQSCEPRERRIKRNRARRAIDRQRLVAGGQGDLNPVARR